MTRTQRVETVFSINSLLSRPLNPWTDIQPDRPKNDCVAAQGLELQTHFCLSTHHNNHVVFLSLFYIFFFQWSTLWKFFQTVLLFRNGVCQNLLLRSEQLKTNKLCNIKNPLLLFFHNGVCQNLLLCSEQLKTNKLCCVKNNLISKHTPTLNC